jgi:hypothetical protein
MLLQNYINRHLLMAQDDTLNLIVFKHPHRH